MIENATTLPNKSCSLLTYIYGHVGDGLAHGLL